MVNYGRSPIDSDLVPVFSAFSAAMQRDLEIHPIVKGFLDVPHVPRLAAQPMTTDDPFGWLRFKRRKMWNSPWNSP